MDTEEWIMKMEKFFRNAIERADEKLNFLLSKELKEARFHFRRGQFDQAVEHLERAKSLIWA